MARKKREPFNLIVFTGTTIKVVMYICMVPALIITLPLVILTGTWLFISSFVKGMQKDK